MFGVGSQATAQNATAIGFNSLADRADSISVGKAGAEKQITNVKAGTQGTDAVNLTQVQGLIAAGSGTGGTSSQYQSTGSNNANINPSADRALAMGDGAKVGANADDSIAIGTGAEANGEKSISVGTGNIVNGKRSGALGDPSYIAADDSYGIGNNNVIGDPLNVGASGNQTFVLGNNVNTQANNAVILGNNSASNRDNTVSVGAANVERQIIHVAAGTQTTDAVNKKQLDDGLAAKVDQSALFNPVTGILNPVTGLPSKIGYDTPTVDKITLRGTGGTTISNVAAGTLATDAVNKQQLDTAIAGVSGGAVASDNYAHTSTATALGSARGTAHISTNNGTTLTSVAGITVTSTSLNMDDIDSFTVGGVTTTKADQPAKVAAFINAAKKGGNITVGINSSAMGMANIASGFNSSAVGSNNTVSGAVSSAVGYGNAASGFFSNAIGVQNSASKTFSNAIGSHNQATGTLSNAIGSGINNALIVPGVGGVITSIDGIPITTTATSVAALNTGNITAIDGNTNPTSDEKQAFIDAVQKGQNIASGVAASAVGVSNNASGAGSNAVGLGNTASGNRSSALGSKNTASGSNSSAVGYGNEVSGSTRAC